MTEQQYEKALQALGAKNVTTERQKNNGTTAFKLPTGQVVSEHKSGYIRRYMYREGQTNRFRCMLSTKSNLSSSLSMYRARW
jgi:protein subunit release factor A